MKTKVHHTPEEKMQQQITGTKLFMQDNRSSAIAQLQLQKIMKPENRASLQHPKNNTGLPDTLKTGIENLSGIAMDDVNVHYNSPEPAQLQAHAYAQGTDIHIAPGQEHHLPHEAWHVVQQKQGRVNPTAQLKRGVSINDDAELEKEADKMGEKSLYGVSEETPMQLKVSGASGTVFQLTSINNGKLQDNKGRVKDITLGKISSFDGFDSTGKAKTLKINVKGNGVVTWYRFYDKGGVESGNTNGPGLPDFYFRIHDIPNYLPEWSYGTEDAESQHESYGKVKITSFRTPSGQKTVDVKLEGGNKITVERKFVVDAVFDESEIKQGYRVEYRQYIKGFFKYMGNLNPHTLYNNVALSQANFNEDGNRGAIPYGRRDKGNDATNKYNTDNPAAITYHAEDIPGMQLTKDENCEINLSFIGKLVVVTAESEDPVADLIERSWSFSGKVKNRGNGLFDIT